MTTAHRTPATTLNARHPLLEGLTSALAQARTDRRGFLTFAAKGLAVAASLPLAGRAGRANAAATNKELATAYIHIGADGSIVLAFGGAEMGQGSMTGLAQILAEELCVDWNQVTIAQSGVDPIVTYVTGGSSAVRGRYVALRNAGAAARELLVAAAMAQKGDLVRDNYTAASAVVRHTPSGTTWSYASLSTTASQQQVPSDLRLTNPANFRLIGRRMPRVDIPLKVNGAAKYGIDAWSPDMVFAAIKHCPTLGGTLATLPAKPSGAIAVVACKASDTRGKVIAGTVNAVAVVASNTWLAMRYANSLSVAWTLPASTADVDSTAIANQAQTLLNGNGAWVAEPAVPAGYTPQSYASVIEPQVNTALGTPTVDKTFTLPYVAHATMEVLNCTVNIAYANGVAQSCDIWAPTQAASFVAPLAAGLIGIPQSAVNVHTMFLGGGLGRKFEVDYVSQAIQVAMAVKRPVKLTWKREEDFGHDQYRPFALVRVKGKLDSNKRIAAWSVRNVSQSILGQRGWLPPNTVDSQAVEGAVRLPYDIPVKLTEWVPLQANIPVGFWRSVGSSINAFAVECAIDELAQLAGIEPFTFRYNHMATSDRARAVLYAADVATSSWRNSLPAGHAWGVALAESFGTVVCEVVEVSQPALGSLRIHRVHCAIDCGTVVNPDSVEAQMQGGIVHAISATLWGQQTFTAGRANALNFNANRVLKLTEMPAVTVQIMPSANPPSGVGEPGVPPLAPAVVNAYSRLLGVRQYNLPLFPGSRMGGL